jgi:hypothetical protein
MKYHSCKEFWFFFLTYLTVLSQLHRLDVGGLVGEDVEGSSYSLFKNIIPAFAWVDLRKPQKILARIVTPQAKN